MCPMLGTVDGGNTASPKRSSTSPGQQVANNRTTGKVRLTGMGLVKASCHEDNFFLIDGSKAAQGYHPKVMLTRDSDGGASVPVDMRIVAKDVYEVCYAPTQAGNHSLNVTWGDRVVNGCPLKIVAQDASGGGGREVGHNTPAAKVTWYSCHNI